jgi:hypothetical protein
MRCGGGGAVQLRAHFPEIVAEFGDTRRGDWQGRPGPAHWPRAAQVLLIGGHCSLTQIVLFTHTHTHAQGRAHTALGSGGVVVFLIE